MVRVQATLKEAFHWHLRLAKFVFEKAAALPLYSDTHNFFINNLLVRIQLIIEMLLVDRPCAMGV